MESHKTNLVIVDFLIVFPFPIYAVFLGGGAGNAVAISSLYAAITA